MWKLVFKNLWANRKKNIWLFLELIAVAVISWKIIDTITVNYYAIQREPGYTQDNMHVLRINTYLDKDMRYDSLQQEENIRIENLQRLRSLVNNLPGVTSTTYALNYQLFETTGNKGFCFPVDTVLHCANVTLDFVPGTDFFTTLGIPGKKAEEYSKMPLRENDFILDEKFAQVISPNEKIDGRRIFLRDSVPGMLVGTLPHVIPKSASEESFVVYNPISMEELLEDIDWGGLIVVRTRPDVSTSEFNRMFAEKRSELHAGNFYISELTDFATRRSSYLYSSGNTNKLRINTALAIFFGISLCLGVAGSFYLQTRRRTEEGGIMRSFGATRWFLVRELILEGVVLTTITWIIGCLIYLQFALKEGLQMIGWNHPHESMANWTDHFAQHFIIVSLIVYVILLIVVTVGIYIPAHYISRSNPVDALRDE